MKKTLLEEDKIAAGFKDYRRPTKEERQRFGGPWIAVFKKKERTKA